MSQRLMVVGRRRAGRVAALICVLGMSLVLTNSATAAMPAFSTLPPERLYTLVDIPIAFTGTDPISSDNRELNVSVTDDNCDPLADDVPPSGPDYSLSGCARVQLDVSHGEIAVAIDTDLTGVTEPDAIATGGAIVDQSTNGDGTGLVIYLNGTQTQLNAALDTLTYTPNAGYEYNGANPERLRAVVVDGTVGTDTITHDVQIRVEQVNDGPDLTAPFGPYDVAASSSTDIPTVAPPVGTNGDFFVDDPDIDEGENDRRMLLAMFATCGQFDLRGGTFVVEPTLTALLADFGLDPATTTTLLGLLPSEITGASLDTGAPGDPHVAWAGIGTMDEVNYALSQVSFHAPGSAAVCELITFVTDLGNNGLPVQYLGSPIGGQDMPQPGVEVPAFGLDVGFTTFNVAGGATVAVPPTLQVNEGDAVDIPISISTPLHPEFQVGLVASAVTASAGDYDDPASPADYPVNDAGPLNVPFQSTEDSDPEPDETVTVTIDLPGEGQPNPFRRLIQPRIGLDNDEVTITIVDDDDESTTTTTTDGSTTTTDSTTTTTDSTTTTTDSTTTTTDGSTTTTDSTTTTTDGSTTTTDSTTTTTDSTTTTTDSTTTTTESTTTTTDGSTTTTDGSTTTTDGSTTTTDGSTTTTDGGSTTTTDGSTTTTDDGSTTTTDDPGSTTTTDPDDPGTTSTTLPSGGGTLDGTTTTTDPSDVLGSGQEDLPATGGDSLEIMRLATLLTILGLGLAGWSSRRRAALDKG